MGDFSFGYPHVHVYIVVCFSVVLRRLVPARAGRGRQQRERHPSSLPHLPTQRAATARSRYVRCTPCDVIVLFLQPLAVMFTTNYTVIRRISLDRKKDVDYGKWLVIKRYVGPYCLSNGKSSSNVSVMKGLRSLLIDNEKRIYKLWWSV